MDLRRSSDGHRKAEGTCYVFVVMDVMLIVHVLNVIANY